MAKNVVAIIGTYRKGHITDQIVAEILRACRQHGAQTETIFLLDRHIEFCTNCRACTQDADGAPRGPCRHDDDMKAILDRIDAADALVLASPVNFGSATALTKRFIERLIGYAHWPWQNGKWPRLRIKKPDKKAVTVTSAACPGWLARWLMPHAPRQLKAAARTVGARRVDSIYFGLAARRQDAQLTPRQRQRAYRAGGKLVR
ncbi:MAG: flavodoxin family protein [Sedimentisphaerales bacterium]|nr:flavodoxin family protein [Sedimentisphaerales bacterium]